MTIQNAAIITATYNRYNEDALYSILCPCGIEYLEGNIMRVELDMDMDKDWVLNVSNAFIELGLDYSIKFEQS